MLYRKGVSLTVSLLIVVSDSDEPDESDCVLMASGSLFLLSLFPLLAAVPARWSRATLAQLDGTTRINGRSCAP